MAIVHNSPDHAWLLQDLDTGAEHVFKDEHIAMHNAERIVGNRAAATFEDGYLYGPGDGTVRVMVRCFPRNLILAMGHEFPIA